jgi:hypothetical protein
MVIKLVLIDKLPMKESIISRYKKYVREMVKGFQSTLIQFNKLRNYDNRIEISIQGPEEVFIKNLLMIEVGIVQNFKDIEIGMRLKGNLVDVGKVGLISLNTLREQLCKGKEKSTPEIIKAYDFINDFPLNIKITSIDREKGNLKGLLEPNILSLYNKLMKENLEAVFLSGETKAQLKKVLEKTDHLRDIISIKKYGFLENIIILKDTTDAPGIISEIGRYLKNCRLSAIRPERIKKLWE